jgi:hypothetical protein
VPAHNRDQPSGEPWLHEITLDKACGANHNWTKDSAKVTADALEALDSTAEAQALNQRHGLRASTE